MKKWKNLMIIKIILRKLKKTFGKNKMKKKLMNNKYLKKVKEAKIEIR